MAGKFTIIFKITDYTFIPTWYCYKSLSPNAIKLFICNSWVVQIHFHCICIQTLVLFLITENCVNLEPGAYTQIIKSIWRTLRLKIVKSV